MKFAFRKVVGFCHILSPEKAPGKANILAFCRLFHRKTCGVEQTPSTLLSVRKLALNGEASQECVNLWGYLECSICDPKIGVQPGAPLICAYFCDRIFRACSEAGFVRDTNSLDLAPCSPGELVCAKASYLFSNGTELCNVAGFSVLPVEPGNAELLEECCYHTQGSLYSIHSSWRPSQKKKPQKSVPAGKQKCVVFNEDAPSRVRKTFLDGKVYCGLGLTVLAAGLFFIRRRDPNFSSVAAILRGKENPAGELKKKNKKLRKKKNR